MKTKQRDGNTQHTTFSCFGQPKYVWKCITSREQLRCCPRKWFYPCELQVPFAFWNISFTKEHLNEDRGRFAGGLVQHPATPTSQLSSEHPCVSPPWGYPLQLGGECLIFQTRGRAAPWAPCWVYVHPSVPHTGPTGGSMGCSILPPNSKSNLGSFYLPCTKAIWNVLFSLWSLISSSSAVPVASISTEHSFRNQMINWLLRDVGRICFL